MILGLSADLVDSAKRSGSISSASAYKNLPDDESSGTVPIARLSWARNDSISARSWAQ